MKENLRSVVASDATRQLCKTHRFSPEGFVNVKRLEKRDAVVRSSPILAALSQQAPMNEQSALSTSVDGQTQSDQTEAP